MAENFLIIGPSWVGDMVMAQTLFVSLKKLYPDCKIDVLSPAWCEALLARMPEVDNSLVSPFQHGQFLLQQRYKFGRGLRDKAYTRAIVLPNSWKSALVPYFAKIPIRSGWVGEMRYHLLNDIRKLDKNAYPLMIERFMALAEAKDSKLNQPYPRPHFSITASELEDSLQQQNITYNKSDKILALCPGAEFGSSKRWPAEYYAKLAQVALEAGWKVWLFGSPKDKLIADVIVAQAGDCLNLISKTNLAQAVDLLSLATVVVSNDSGLMHIAAALDRPLVAIYGSTSTKFTPPQAQKFKIMQLNLECQPCFKRECPLQHHRCMRDIHPDQVWASVSDFV